MPRQGPLPSMDFRGFAPDVDSRTPGVFVDCGDMVATPRGFMPINSMAIALPGAIPGVNAAYYAVYPDGKTALYAGTKDALYEGVKVWEPRYTVGAFDKTSYPWSFAQFGNYNVAVNGAVTLYHKPGETEYKPIPDNPPFGRLVESVGLFLMLAAPGNLPDQWWACDIGNLEKWQPHPTSQAANGRLLATPGPIVAMLRINQNQVALYKRHSTYLGRFVGPPVLWEMVLQSSEAGALGPRAVVAISDAHFIVGDANFYVADGGGPPQRIDTPLRKWFFTTQLDRLHDKKVLTWWDRAADIVFIHYPAKGTNGVLRDWLAWHRLTNRWTRGKLDVAAVAAYDQMAVGMTYDQFGGATGTWDAQTYPWEEPANQTPPTFYQTLLKTDGILYRFTGPPVPTFFKTNDFGDDSMYSFLRRLRFTFQHYPQSPFMVQLYKRDVFGGQERLGVSGILQRDGWVNVRQASRVHNGRVTTNGIYELIGMEYDAVPAGSR